MTRRTHEDGQLVRSSVDYDYVVHRDEHEPGPGEVRTLSWVEADAA